VKAIVAFFLPFLSVALPIAGPQRAVEAKPVRKSIDTIESDGVAPDERTFVE